LDSVALLKDLRARDALRDIRLQVESVWPVKMKSVGSDVEMFMAQSSAKPRGLD
jgi:hypothetical protein